MAAVHSAQGDYILALFSSRGVPKAGKEAESFISRKNTLKHLKQENSSGDGSSQGPRMQGHSKKGKENDGQKRETGRRMASSATCGPLAPAASGAQE